MSKKQSASMKPGALTTYPERRWPKDYRETAYELYAGIAERCVIKTADLLSGMKRKTVPVSTVQRWKDADDWEERVKAEPAAASQLLWLTHVRELMVAAPSAIIFLASVVSGKVGTQEEAPGMPSIASRVRAAIAIETAARTVLFKQVELHQGDGRTRSAISTARIDPLPTDPDELAALEARRRREREKRSTS